MLLIVAFAYNQTPDTWTQKADFGGTPRLGAVGFSIGNKGYIGTGASYIDEPLAKDFWEYDPHNNTWSQKADFGGGVRGNAIGFGIGSKGYIGTGSDGHGYRKDFWEYDPIANTWLQKADFRGKARLIAIGFSIGNNGYIGIGVDSEYTYLNEFWQYDPVTDVWTRKADFAGTARAYATGFCISNKGYIGIGENISSVVKDFWEYDPATDVWTQKADFGGGNREDAVGFSIGTKGYIGDGYNEIGVPTKDFWEYDPVNNLWKKKADVGGPVRLFAVGFNIEDKGYIGTGNDNTINSLKDFWQYTPSTDTTIGKCQPPTDLKVPIVSYKSAILKWRLPVDAPSGFDVRHNIKNSTIVTTRHRPGRFKHIILADLLPGTTYEWQIKSDCSADTSNWVSGPDFTTLSSTGLLLNSKVSSDDLTADAVKILPNPSKSNFVVQMQLADKAASTTLSLYNTLGVKVWQQNVGMLSGIVSRNINLENKLSPGVYVLIIQNGDIQLMQKIVIAK